MSDEVREPEIRWVQPFRWGLLTAGDAEREWELPEQATGSTVSATETSLAVQVRHSQDVEEPADWPSDLGLPEVQVHVVVAFSRSPGGSPVAFEGLLHCHSGRLATGDAENERVVDVHPGVLLVQVSLFPVDFAEYVVLRLVPP